MYMYIVSYQANNQFRTFVLEPTYYTSQSH